jgi:hypothetical protein
MGGQELLKHGGRGIALLRLDTTHYWPGPRPGARLIVYTPAGSDSRDRLEKLAANL